MIKFWTLSASGPCTVWNVVLLSMRWTRRHHVTNAEFCTRFSSLETNAIELNETSTQ